MYTAKEIECLITRDDLSIKEKEILDNFINSLTDYEYDCFIECFRDFNITVVDLACIYNSTKQEIVRTIADLIEKLVDKLNKEIRVI